MPTRVFSQFDAATIEFVVDGTVADGENGSNVVALSTLLNQTGVGSWEMNPNLNGNNNPPGVGDANSIIAGDNVALIQRWRINYLNFPAIPANAQVKKLTFNRPRSVNYNFNNTGGGGTFDPLQAKFLFYSDAGGTPIYFSDFDDQPWITPRVFNESIVGIPADEVIFDLTGGPTFKIRDELIADFSEFDNNLYGISIISATDDITNPTTANLSGSLTFGLGWTVTVEYEEGYEWHLSQDTSPVDEGSIVTVTSDPDAVNPLDLEDITDIDIQFPDPNNPGSFITIDAGVFVVSEDGTTLTFTVPSFGAFSPPYFSVLITSTQFSGSISLGTLTTIYFLSASGLYTLEFGKTNDTLYLEDDLPTTLDVKIPDPFIKTGFIDG